MTPTEVGTIYEARRSIELGFAVSLLRTQYRAAEAEDAVQSAAVALLATTATIKQPVAVFHRAVERKCIDLLRRPLPQQLDDTGLESAVRIRDAKPNPEQVVVRHERQVALEQAFGTLATKQRQEVEGRLQGVAAGGRTRRSRYHRAIGELRRSLL